MHHKTGNLFDKFRVGAQCCIMEVCTAVTMYLKPVYVKLPNSSQCVYIAYIASEIKQQSCLTGVSCYLDGAHIHASNGPFMGQRELHQSKSVSNYPSVNVLAACDEKCTSFVSMQTEQDQSTMLEFMGVNLYGVEGPGPTHNLGDGAQPLTGPL